MHCPSRKVISWAFKKEGLVGVAEGRGWCSHNPSALGGSDIKRSWWAAASSQHPDSRPQSALKGPGLVLAQGRTDALLHALLACVTEHTKAECGDGGHRGPEQRGEGASPHTCPSMNLPQCWCSGQTTDTLIPRVRRSR